MEHLSLIPPLSFTIFQRQLGCVTMVLHFKCLSLSASVIWRFPKLNKKTELVLKIRATAVIVAKWICLFPLCFAWWAAKVDRTRRLYLSIIHKSERSQCNDACRTQRSVELWASQLPLGPTPVSSIALVKGDSLRICWCPLYRQNLESTGYPRWSC